MPAPRNFELFKLLLPDLQNWRQTGWGGTYTLSAAVDVAGPVGHGLFLIRDVTNGGIALVLYHIAAVPVIVSQTGGFIVGAPGPTQIGIKDLTTSIGFRAGSSRDGVKVRVTAVYG